MNKLTALAIAFVLTFALLIAAVSVAIAHPTSGTHCHPAATDRCH